MGDILPMCTSLDQLICSPVPEDVCNLDPEAPHPPHCVWPGKPRSAFTAYGCLCVLWGNKVSREVRDSRTRGLSVRRQSEPCLFWPSISLPDTGHPFPHRCPGSSWKVPTVETVARVLRGIWLWMPVTALFQELSLWTFIRNSHM